MSKHTPGEWQAINWTYHSTSTVVVDDPSVVTGKRVIAECATEEDARLIAAAPELLEAMASLLREHDAVFAGRSDGAQDSYYNAHPGRAIAYRKARAAIAKATGEQP